MQLMHSFLEESALNPKVEVLQITSTTLSDRIINSSSSSESYPAAMPVRNHFQNPSRNFKNSYLKHKHKASEHKIVFDPKYMLFGDNVHI